MGEGYVHQRSLLAHVVPRRHERVALAEARLRDFGEVRSCVEDGPEAAGRVVPRLRSAVTWPLDRRRDAAARRSPLAAAPASRPFLSTTGAPP